ncbi:hypothetical protein EDD16DRAFT_1481734 [Pisolithus croceorrhizus]|nr:hypothetical protein EV401DRAFT_1869667 [Pisolithus croceorrhizus]KAI6117006.1 hypothetical protein EDD16DRAFT_1481734 [Pisolithus croceorrhizus]KAI6156244.1 hypothetical protein EDD17DRAFT_1489518 [Pisolithus thermaeus]
MQLPLTTLFFQNTPLLSIVHQAVPDQDPTLTQVQGMSFEEMKVFFYDQQINEMRAQGKEFSQ